MQEYVIPEAMQHIAGIMVDAERKMKKNIPEEEREDAHKYFLNECQAIHKNKAKLIEMRRQQPNKRKTAQPRAEPRQEKTARGASSTQPRPGQTVQLAKTI